MTDFQLTKLINCFPILENLTDEQLKNWYNTLHNEKLDCQMELYKRKIDFN